MPRKKVYKVDPFKDPLGFYEQVLVPKALIAFHDIIKTRVPRHHRQWVRSLTIQRAAATSVVNTYIGLKQLGIQNENADKLREILERIKRHDSDLNNHPLLDEVGIRKLKEVGAVDVLPAPRYRETVDAEPEDDAAD